MPGKDPARGARDDGTRDFAGADRGQPGGGRRGGNGGGPKQGPNRDGSTIDVNPKGVGNFSGGRPESMAAAARQVYSKPVGPTMSGDPMGGVSHFSQEGNALDKMLGYDNIGERVAAYQNNPNASHNAANYVTMMPNFPQATPGYVAGQFADMLAGLVPGGGILTSGYRAGNFGLTGDTDGPFTDAAEAMGASRGPRGPDVPGGGFEGRSTAALHTPATRTRCRAALHTPATRTRCRAVAPWPIPWRTCLSTRTARLRRRRFGCRRRRFRRRFRPGHRQWWSHEQHRRRTLAPRQASSCCADLHVAGADGGHRLVGEQHHREGGAP